MANLIVTPKTFQTYSLGCRTNQAEMEKISLQLSSHGLQQTLGTPDIILLNTCVVTQKAEKETRQKIRELKTRFPSSFLVVLGCAATAKEKFNINLPEADLLIANKEKPNLYTALKKLFDTQPKIWYEKTFDGTEQIASFSLNKYQESGRKFIKIEEGCNKFCSYCITCHLRGKPTSVPSRKIVQETNYWVRKGIKEIILTGTNIGLWGKDFAKQESLNNLIKKILLESEVERLSFSSIYPEMLISVTDSPTGLNPDGEFLNILIKNPRLSQYLHLSVQSGSPSVLERMNRKANLDKLLRCLRWIKEQNPSFTFRADIIVGFPNETEEEFKETLEFIKKARICFVHPFLFSKRRNTKAEEMIENKIWKEVPLEVKKQRLEKLKKTVKEVQDEEAKKMIGITTNNLVIREAIDLHDLGYKLKSARTRITWCEGITENGWPIKIRTMNYKSRIKEIKGKILPAITTGFDGTYLLGEIISFPTN